jgi:hypothetical protein
MINIHKVITMDHDDHNQPDNELVTLLDDGWHIINSTPIVPAVSRSGPCESTIRQWGIVAYVMRYQS